MVIDSGTTSQFCSEDMDLPKEGKSNKTVHLPNDDTLQTTKRTSLPFRQLKKKEREAHILSHWQQSLMSVHKLSNEGYTTIFHPENEGATVHEKGTLTITTSIPPVLQGCKEEEGKLWTVTATENNEEEINNIQLTIKQTKHTLPQCIGGIPS
jgi:hypothetical protein